MKRVIFAVCFVLLLCACSYGATSDDTSVYVRQDVFGAKMETFMAEMRLSIEQIRREIQGTYAKTHDEIREVSARLTVVEGRMSSLEIMIYWVLGTLAVIFAALAVILTMLAMRTQQKESPESKSSSAPPFTLEDVKRLIADAQLNGMPQI